MRIATQPRKRFRLPGNSGIEIKMTTNDSTLCENQVENEIFHVAASFVRDAFALGRSKQCTTMRIWNFDNIGEGKQARSTRNARTLSNTYRFAYVTLPLLSPISLIKWKTIYTCAKKRRKVQSNKMARQIYPVDVGHIEFGRPPNFPAHNNHNRTWAIVRT